MGSNSICRLTPPSLLVAPDTSPAREGHWDERSSKIEIALPNGVRLRVNGSVSEKALSRVLRAVKGAREVVYLDQILDDPGATPEQGDAIGV